MKILLHFDDFLYSKQLMVIYLLERNTLRLIQYFLFLILDSNANCQSGWALYLKFSKYFVERTSSIENSKSTSTFTGRFLPSGTCFSCVVTVK